MNKTILHTCQEIIDIFNSSRNCCITIKFYKTTDYNVISFIITYFSNLGFKINRNYTIPSENIFELILFSDKTMEFDTESKIVPVDKEYHNYNLSQETLIC